MTDITQTFTFIMTVLLPLLLITIIFYSLIFSYFFISFSFPGYRGFFISGEKFLDSFFFFFFNYLILVSYISGLYYLFSSGFSEPIHLDSLSQYSIYRYAILLLVSSIGIIFYLLYRYVLKDKFQYFQVLSFPYLRHEVYLIMDTWADSCFNPICSWIMDQMYAEKRVRYLFLSLHFLIFSFSRFILALLFTNFVFLQGDLRLSLYLLPLSFLIWLLRFFDYYFFAFVESESQGLHCLINVTADHMEYEGNGIVKIRNEDLRYELKPLAYEMGFNNELFVLQQWLIVNFVKTGIMSYNAKISYFNLLIFGIRWFSILVLILSFS